MASMDVPRPARRPILVRELAWRDELSRRSEEIAKGTVETVGWTQVLERVADGRETRLRH